MIKIIYKQDPLSEDKTIRTRRNFGSMAYFKI